MRKAAAGIVTRTSTIERRERKAGGAEIPLSLHRGGVGAVYVVIVYTAGRSLA